MREAAQAPGVSISTVRRWEREGKLTPDHTSGGHRRYDLAQLFPKRFHPASPLCRNTLVYAYAQKWIGPSERLITPHFSMRSPRAM
ncbi:MAG: helix-turn-helix domain-containing protein [Thermaerobacter sp.]|nr:helix-turn-helix domain-containing protein [Thermaerobacter sp.]